MNAQQVLYTSKRKPATIEQVWQVAEQMIASRLVGQVVDNPNLAAEYCVSKLGLEEREHFAAIFLDSRHRMLSFEILFSGTIDSSAVYPREIVKRALAMNAAAVIITHNHPSGTVEPSAADIAITGRVRQALALVDIRLLDHIIVGGARHSSLAASGRV